MGTNAELLTQAMSRLGQRSSTRVRADVLAEINTTIDRLERGGFLPWFLEQTATIAVVASTASYSISTSFIREVEECRPYWVLSGVSPITTQVTYLQKRGYSDLRGLGSETSLKYYAIQDQKIHIRMVPDVAYALYLQYYHRQTGNLADDSSTVSNLWLVNAHDWVVNEALATVADLHLHNSKLADKLRSYARAAKADLYIYHESRVHTNQDYYVGGSSGS